MGAHAGGERSPRSGLKGARTSNGPAMGVRDAPRVGHQAGLIGVKLVAQAADDGWIFNP
jgi:hypothetical protein